MAKIKSYSDLQQSKKLAEILPLESADMHLTNSSTKGEMYTDEFKPSVVPYLRAKDSLDAYSKIVNNMIAWEVIPCWPLASLLGVLPNIINNETLFIETSAVLWHIGYRNIYTARADNPVDACYEMILKLNELNLL